MSQIQLNFTLRVASKSCKTVHLVGSWDGYKANLPLSRDNSSSKPQFKGTFRFMPPTLLPGSRYWYYYVLDAHSVTYDPKQEFVIEPTTGRTLNILKIPGAPSSTSATATSRSSSSSHTTKDMRPSGHRHSRTSPANGRSLSPSQIQHPFPSRPYETKKFSSREMEALSRRYAAQRLVESSSSDGSSDEDSAGYSSGGYSPVPSLSSSRTSANSSPSSISSLGSGGGRSSCTCERFAVTRDGVRYKLDCKGTVCQGSEDGSSCSSDSSESEEEERYRKSSSGRHGSSRHHGSSSKSHHSSSSSGKSRRHGLVVRR